MEERTTRNKLAKEVLVKGCSLVHPFDMRAPTPNDFLGSDRLLILIHGFTSHGIYLRDMALDLSSWIGSTFLFNYHSYRGVEIASNSLKEMLISYDKLTSGAILRRGVYLISHSMGGLVARQFALDDECGAMVRGIVNIGTPNNGALANKTFVNLAIMYGEYMSSAMPEARLPACISAKQLTKSDDSERPLIDRLNMDWKMRKSLPPTLTVSGGMNYLVVSNNTLQNKLANMFIQTLMSGEANDGLVTESSVDMSSFLSAKQSVEYRHLNAYTDYPILNHTNLIQNQSIWNAIKNWISDVEGEIRQGTRVTIS